MSKNKHRTVTSRVKPGFTPYQESELLMPETEYYHSRLTQLIETEIEVLRMMDHENVIRYFRHTNEHDMYSLHMEYCDMGDLYGILKNKEVGRNVFDGMEREFVFDFMKQVSKGLDYIHERNIIHRDIKLQNILVKSTKNKRYEFKISDLGFACYDMYCSDLEEEFILAKQYYRICGTPYYMAPELVLNIDCFEKDDGERFYDKSIDVWSLGVCLYELIYNKVIFPYDIEDIAQLKVFFEGITQDYVDITIKHSSNLDKKLEILLCKMLRIDRQTRISTQELCSFVDDEMKTKGVLTMMDTRTYDPRLYYDVRVKISTSVKPCEMNVEKDTGYARGVVDWVGHKLGLW